MLVLSLAVSIQALKNRLITQYVAVRAHNLMKILMGYKCVD
jgi:hypothetical protein